MKMNLWVRNQDKTILQKVDNLLISDGDNAGRTFNIYTNSLLAQNVSGRYKTKERAIEILDEIQNILMPKYILDSSSIRPDDSWVENGIIMQKYNANVEIKELSTFVYQMPAE